MDRKQMVAKIASAIAADVEAEVRSYKLAIDLALRTLAETDDLYSAELQARVAAEQALAARGPEAEGTSKAAGDHAIRVLGRDGNGDISRARIDGWIVDVTGRDGNGEIESARFRPLADVQSEEDARISTKYGLH